MKRATVERAIINTYKRKDVANLIEAAKLCDVDWSFHEIRKKIKQYLGSKKYKQMVSWKKSQRYREQEKVYQKVLKCKHCDYIANSNYNGLLTKHLKKEHNIIEPYKLHCIFVEGKEKKKILNDNSKEIQCVLCEKLYLINKTNVNVLYDHFQQKHAISIQEVYSYWPSYKTFVDAILNGETDGTN
jgi:hypothetical protein